MSTYPAKPASVSAPATALSASPPALSASPPAMAATAPVAADSLADPTAARHGWQTGVKDALPLLGGYIPVAISFGLVASQAGFTVLQATLISLLVYAGASQFLFVAMVAAGAPLWLVVLMTLLINARHVVYGPNIAPYIPPGKVWLVLMHGLTDQIFALAHSRLPQMPASARLGWYCSAALIAWLSWVLGTAAGALAGAQIISSWPLLAQVLPYALPALFIVLLAPRFSNRQWVLSLSLAIGLAIAIKLAGFANAAVVLAALAGAVLYYSLEKNARKPRGCHE